MKERIRSQLAAIALAAIPFVSITAAEHRMAEAPWRLADVQGNRTVAQVMPVSLDTVTFEAAWIYLSRNQKFSYAQWRAQTYATICLTDAAWRGESRDNLIKGFMNTRNYIVAPQGRYEISATCIVGRTGLEGAGSFWSPGNGMGHNFSATEFVMRDDIWTPAGPIAERRMFDTPNSSGSAGNFSYNESMTLRNFYLRGPDKKDGITRIGLFLSWLGECTFINQVRADYWTHGFVARGGVPLSIGTISAFWNHEGGFSLLGSALATFEIDVLSGDGNKRLFNAAPGYGGEGGGRGHISLIKYEDGTTGGAPLGNGCAMYLEGQYCISVGCISYANQGGALPQGMVIVKPVLLNGTPQTSFVNVLAAMGQGYSLALKNLVTGSEWLTPSWGGFSISHAGGTDIAVTAGTVYKNGGTTPPPTDPPPTTGQPYPRTAWKATAYKTSGEVATDAKHAIDLMAGRHWTNGENQRADRTQRFTVQMEKAQRIGSIVLDVLPLRPTDYPRGLYAEVSTNGTTWTATPVTLSGTTRCTVTFTNAPTASWVRMAPNVAVGHWWSIDELNIYP